MLRRYAELEERTQRRRFETTLASIGDGVIATTPDGNVSFMNIAAETITGWTQEEALGSQIETVFQIIDQDSRKPVENQVRKAIRKGDIVKLTDHTMLLARDGTEVPIDDSGSVIRDSEAQKLMRASLWSMIAAGMQLERGRRRELQLLSHEERGHYLHPSLFGQSEDKSVLAVHQPTHFEILKKMREGDR